MYYLFGRSFPVTGEGGGNVNRDLNKKDQKGCGIQGELIGLYGTSPAQVLAPSFTGLSPAIPARRGGMHST
jgi:hypothetical protein